VLTLGQRYPRRCLQALGAEASSWYNELISKAEGSALVRGMRTVYTWQKPSSTELLLLAESVPVIAFRAGDERLV
jgi:hypothetical protein